MIRPFTRASAWIIVSIVLTSCSQHQGQALDIQVLDGATCAPSSPEKNDVFLFGHRIVNVVNEPVRISEFTLNDADNLELFRVRLVPASEENSQVGTAIGWPPKDKEAFGWDKGLDIPNGIVEGAASYNVILGLKRIDPAKSGSVSNFSVNYSQSSRNMTQTATTKVLISTNECEELPDF